MISTKDVYFMLFIIILNIDFEFDSTIEIFATLNPIKKVQFKKFIITAKIYDIKNVQLN